MPLVEGHRGRPAAARAGGVTRTQPVSARVFFAGDVLRGNGEATVRQSEFGIRPVTVAGGMLKVQDAR